MKLKVFKDADIDEDGVEPVWVYLCPSTECKAQGRHRLSALYWENALRAARRHIEYHKAMVSFDA